MGARGHGRDKPCAAPQHEHILGALERCSHLRHLQQLQAHLAVLGHAHTHFFSFKLLRFCALVLADLFYARALFDAIPSPNVYLYTAMITAYSSQPDPASALRLFTHMLRQGRPCPNHFIYPHVLRSCSDASDLGSVGSVHARVAKTVFHAHGVVQTALLDAYAKCSELETARRLFDALSERNVVSWTAMITGYMRAGMIGNAMCLFEEMPERDVPSWNSIIAGCTQNGLFTEAIALFRRMIVAGARPNETTVVCVLSACGHLGTLQLGEWIHAHVYRNGIGPSPFVSNALMDMYGKCGSLKEARRVFDAVPRKSLTLWNSMINCLALHGHSEDAIETFKEMELDGPEPDAVTFVGLLNACTHGGLVDNGQAYFKSMTHGYGIEPRIEHYGCLIDLLGRAGKFKEVIEVIEDMGMEPDEVVWGSLLNSCRIYGDMKLAEFAVGKLLEMEPGNAGYAALLANLYSASGRWEEMGEVRKRSKETGGKKLPGCSWIEVDSRVQQFYSCDRSHPMAQEIIDVLECLAGFLDI
uniref:Pentatricopeptide repeat-containing protein At1g33350 n=1 Tax=Anthurium amnicola TaxID=1678845 RepID=A0A1D1Z152_9ARAE